MRLCAHLAVRGREIVVLLFHLDVELDRNLHCRLLITVDEQLRLVEVGVLHQHEDDARVRAVALRAAGSERGSSREDVGRERSGKAWCPLIRPGPRAQTQTWEV